MDRVSQALPFSPEWIPNHPIHTTIQAIVSLGLPHTSAVVIQLLSNSNVDASFKPI
jgi:hypothetical protein